MKKVLSFLKNKIGAKKSAYLHWIETFEKKMFFSKKEIKSKILALKDKPQFSILLPVYNPSMQFLNEAIKSALAQTYPYWELCVVDDASIKPISSLLKKWQKKDARIHVTYRDQNGHISKATQDAFNASNKSWICVLDHDDCLSPHALFEFAAVIAARPQAKMIYSDEDKLNEKGERIDSYFKPDWSPDFMLSQNYLNHLTCFQRSLVEEVGGWREGFEGAQDYDLYLRMMEKVNAEEIHHIPKVLYHWRQTENSTAMHLSNKNYAHEAAKKALEEHLFRMNENAKVLSVCEDRHFRIQYEIKNAPLVSIIIPTKDKKEVLQKCIESIIEKTTYPQYEILIVDHESKEKDTVAYLEELKKKTKIKMIKYVGEFNYSKMNNEAVLHALGKILLFLNNDTEVINNGWLTEMVSHAVRAEIGCVGAKLYYRNNTIQHAGVVLGIQGVAGHSHKYIERNADGYFMRLRLIHNVSAVTGACLAVRKEIFEACCGFDPENLAVAFNDIDLCLKVREAGYRNLWTPYAELYHDESLTRGSDETCPDKQQRFKNEIDFMQTKWGSLLKKDPYYSPNLTLEREDFSIVS